MIGRLSFDGVVDRLEFLGLRQRGSSAQCPAHEDMAPSLSIREGRDTSLLLYCHAGCSFSEVIAALTGARPGRRAYRHDPHRLAKAKARAPYITTNDGPPFLYAATDGSQLKKQRVELVDPDTGEALRSFRWFHRTTDGLRWLTGVGGHEPMLYRPAVVPGGRRTPTVVDEGESDADAAAARGITAVSPAHGASKDESRVKWNAGWTAELHDEDYVVVVADDDEAGRAHALGVAALLHADRPDRVVSVFLPAAGLNDIREHLDAGYGFDSLRLLTTTASRGIGLRS